MKRVIISLPAVICLALLAAGCMRIGIDDIDPPYNGEVPEGYARVEVKFVVKGAPEFESRADEENHISNRIDNVNLFWFTDTNGDGQIEDTDPLTERRYFEYGTRQEVFLKRGAVYYVYAVANLEDGQCPNGDLSTYFDDVHTYGELKQKYILNTDKPTPDRTKIAMAATEVTKLTLPSLELDPDATLNPDEVFSPKITLERVFARFIINIYNKVDENNNVISYVNPVSMNGVDFIRGSYLLPRDEDFTADSTGYTGDTYYMPRAVSLVANESPDIVQYPAGSENRYTIQSFEIYTFENRKGKEDAIKNYAEQNSGNPNVKDVYGRYALAPEHATHLRISSLISQNAPDQYADQRGKVLYTWIHAGKGRSTEANPQTDDITNFDVDRNTIYHINVIIDGIDNVTIDTRREYLDQMLILELPPAANQIDAHYVDMPAYISGNAKGMVKIQSGTRAGTESEWVPMSDGGGNDWLRFSMYDPAHLVGGVPVTWYTPEASTVLWIDMPESGLTKRRLLMHFDENVEFGVGGVGAVPANATSLNVNPPSRRAYIRVGFVEGVHTIAEYNAKVAEEPGNESVFYQPVEQFGLKTIGAVGGYVDGRGYTKLLGVESVEETQTIYYNTSGVAWPLPYDSPKQIFWRYRTGTAGNTNHAYDGMAATNAIYTDYRAGAIPPQRGQTNKSPATGYYNPFTNTNAADYCMRKNRDENGDGVITGDEVKWYLPTPVQMSQLFQWRNAFLYPLNHGYQPLWSATATNFYWTCNESDANNALASENRSGTNMTVPVSKETPLRAVRCVRDIGEAKDATSMFYISVDGQLVADFRDHLPDLQTGRYNLSDNQLREENRIAPVFVISKHYTRMSGNQSDEPTLVDFKKNYCLENYRETTNDARQWQVPSERELSIIYAYSEVLNKLLESQHGIQTYPGTANTFHYLRRDGRHWGFTYVQNNSGYWYIDFATGASNQQDKQLTNAYMRCVRYINPSGPIPEPKYPPEQP